MISRILFLVVFLVLCNNFSFAQFNFQVVNFSHDFITLSFANKTKTNFEIFLSESNFKLKGPQFLRLNQQNDTVLDYKNIKQVPNFGKHILTITSNQERKVTIRNLQPKTVYQLLIFERKKDSLRESKQETLNTLAEPPKRSSRNIAFDEITDTSFVISWLNGDGEGRIVLVSEDDMLEQPENGKEYLASFIFGNNKSRVKQAFVVYDGKEPRPRIKVLGLKPATKYIVGVYEYKGDGKFRHYRKEPESNNPRTIFTKLPTPKILSIEETVNKTYLVKWQNVQGATTYIIDVALDNDFKNRIEPFIELDIGNLGEFEFSDLESGKTYFIRIKAKGAAGESLYSPPFKFKTK